MPFLANSPCGTSSAYREGFGEQCGSSVLGAMSWMSITTLSASNQATESGIGVLRIHRHRVADVLKSNSIPPFSGRDVLFIRPRIWLAMSSATSTSKPPVPDTIARTGNDDDGFSQKQPPMARLPITASTTVIQRFKAFPVSWTGSLLRAGRRQMVGSNAAPEVEQGNFAVSRTVESTADLVVTGLVEAVDKTEITAHGNA